jgi:hypothetical protein
MHYASAAPSSPSTSSPNATLTQNKTLSNTGSSAYSSWEIEYAVRSRLTRTRLSGPCALIPNEERLACNLSISTTPVEDSKIYTVKGRLLDNARNPQFSSGSCSTRDRGLYFAATNFSAVRSAAADASAYAPERYGTLRVK